MEPIRCKVCGKLPHEPYRKINAEGAIVEGCVDSIHAPHFLPDTPDYTFHFKNHSWKYDFKILQRSNLFIRDTFRAKIIFVCYTAENGLRRAQTIKNYFGSAYDELEFVAQQMVQHHGLELDSADVIWINEEDLSPEGSELEEPNEDLPHECIGSDCTHRKICGDSCTNGQGCNRICGRPS